MTRIECLDGLRGTAALWVLVGHCMILTGYHAPILGAPDLGVDLFIMLSGFLMVFQYNLRQKKEDWEKPATWVSFWVRRFFRLSPLYFVMLFIALAAGKSIFADRMLIDTFLGSEPQQANRYTDASVLNLLTHVTYVFGLLPAYAYRTPLPDWSLGLEMQFYAVFPFAVLLARRVGWLTAAGGIAGIGLGAVLATKLLHVQFPMPSFLPLKLHVFLAGMLIAAAIGAKKWPYFILSVLLVLVPIGGGKDVVHMAVRLVLMVGFFGLVHWRHVALVDRVSGLLGAPLFHWLGELSFGVYLVHLLVLHPVAAWAIAHWGGEISATARFGLVLAIVASAAYALAYAMYVLIERPGQQLGRLVLKRLGAQRQTVPAPVQGGM